jgi:uncharacterized membrane protein (DUF106 family)
MANKTSLKKEILKQMMVLSTSAFVLVAALAWNAVIVELVTKYIQPLIGGSSTIISLIIYAVVVTLLAVLVTYNLSKLVKE